MKDKFPTIVKENIDTWNDITYGWIINGMVKDNPDNISYGELMTRANDLTNLLFNALREKMGVKTPSIFKEFEETRTDGDRELGMEY